MLSLELVEKLKVELEKLNFSEEKTNQLLKSFEPFFEFNEYMKNRLNLSNEEIKDISDGYFKRESQKRFTEEMYEQIEKDEDFIYVVFSEILVDFANKYEYDSTKTQELKENFIVCLSLLKNYI